MLQFSDKIMMIHVCLSQHFNVPVVYSASDAENPEDSDDEDSIFVTSEFEGETFKRLCDCYCQIVAPPAIIWAATQDEVNWLLICTFVLLPVSYHWVTFCWLLVH